MKLLRNSGYTFASSNQIGENLFATYYRGNNGLHLSYYPAKSLFKITTVTKGALQPSLTQQPVMEVVTPSVAQLGRYGDPESAPGMCYVLQLSDGRFIIIDGGPANEDDELVLLNYLKSKNKNGSKPVIAGWFFTHGHGDHMGLACSFATKYASQVSLQGVYANFPDCDTLSMEREESYWVTTSIVNWNKNQKTYFPDAKNYKLHTGEKFYIGDAEIEVLFTHEDLYPTTIPTGNDTSTVFRITLGGQTMLFLGDSDVTTNNFLTDVYGSELKSDIMQVTHHGFNGATLALYKAIDPDICFWPVEQGRYEGDSKCLGTASGYDFNAWLRATSGSNGQRERQHYHSSVTTVIELS